MFCVKLILNLYLIIVGRWMSYDKSIFYWKCGDWLFIELKVNLCECKLNLLLL